MRTSWDLTAIHTATAHTAVNLVPLDVGTGYKFGGYRRCRRGAERAQHTSYELDTNCGRIGMHQCKRCLVHG